MNAVIYLDRDGTLIEDTGHPYRIDEYRRLPGAAEGLERLQSAGYRLAIVTNQSGIARGLYDEAAFWRFQEQLVRDFAAKGVRFEATYFCPHLPDAGCACRKPRPGMLQRALREMAADPDRSWMVGDRPSDVQAGLAAGLRVLQLGSDLPDLRAVADRILADGRAPQTR
ncbi:MAG: D-glycero-alpha-D-manno-heptose-1,7-bisphosphate 7-phosphatase [Myxococcota bacterium]